MNEELIKEDKEQSTINIGKEIKIISLQEYEQLKNNEKKLEETVDLLKRTRADYLNYIKMAKKQQEEIKEYALVDFFKKIIPYLSMLDTALSHCKNTDNIKSLQDGLEMIIYEFKKIITTEGLQEINPVNEQFDPFISEAETTIETNNPEEDNKVNVIAKGYKFKDRIILPAKVQIKKLKIQSSETTDTPNPD